MFACLALVTGIYFTIVQVKVPQRLHGRVFSLNLLITWSTIPLAFAVVAPAATALARPLLSDGGALRTSVGRVLGGGDGRGIGLVFVLFGLAMAVVSAGALLCTSLAGAGGQAGPGGTGTATGFDGTRVACLDHIEAVWTDMRPLSVRDQR